MTHVKKIRLTSALAGKSFYKFQFNNLLDVSHLKILSFTVYVLIHKKKQDLKLKKFEAQVLNSILVGYDGHTIYRVHICDQGKVIRVKNLYIFKDISQKELTTLPVFKDQLTFQGFPID